MVSKLRSKGENYFIKGWFLLITLSKINDISVLSKQATLQKSSTINFPICEIHFQSNNLQSEIRKVKDVVPSPFYNRKYHLFK